MGKRNMARVEDEGMTSGKGNRHGEVETKCEGGGWSNRGVKGDQPT